MNSVSFTRLFKYVALLSLLPAVAFAHPGHDGGHDFGWDFSAGFTHPLVGADHLLAMLAVGIWAAQLGGRARWLVPATFVGVMTLAATLGQHGVVLPAVEPMIAASLLVFGLMIATAKHLRLSVGLGLTAMFAAFHGSVHGAEIPAHVAAFAYGCGFVAATVLLHACGLGLGALAAAQSPRVARAAGAAVSVVGAVMLVA